MSRPEFVEVDEGLIHAWLDGELTGEEAARVQRLAATNAEWSAAVAEARGLIAASSRIVRALDAVPAGVLPAGSKAAPSRGLHVRPWMRMAAGLMLVAGTAYTVRVVMTPPVAAPAVDIASPPASPATTATPEPPASQTTSQKTSSTNATTSTLGAAGAATPSAAPVSAPTDAAAPPQPQADLPQENRRAAEVVAPPPAPTVATVQPSRAEPEADRAVSSLQRARQERVPSAAPRPALAESSRDFAAGAGAAGPLAALEGCWRATAPDSLAALYRDLAILRQVGDTLVLVLPNANTVRVVRRDDELRGALTASRVSCPPESSTTPRDWW